MSNCFIFAVSKWFKEGGYLLIRKSRFGFWWHFLWCKDLNNAEIQHFVPDAHRLEIEIISKLLFKGHVKTYDAPRAQPEKEV